jgi:hypothetical protein
MAYPRFAPPDRPVLATHAHRPDPAPDGLRQATA